ncbi:MAG TPA: YitT family protein [Pseudogracilibacillus sp.]|nr:YitT family protein [Pseudogracilibacillus sp.]
MMGAASKKIVFKEYMFMIIGSTLVGLAFNIFLLPARLAAGGVSGLSTILFELYQWNPAYVQWLFNIPIFIIGLMTLGLHFSLKSIVGTIFVPLVIWLTADIPFAIENPLLAAIYGGIMLGVGLGIVYRGGGSTGGLATVGQMIKKYSGLSSGYSQLIADGLVVIASAFVFNLELALFAMIAIYVSSKVIDFVQLKTTLSKLMLIITDKEDKIQPIISNEIDRGLTKVRTVGGYSNAEKSMLLCVAEQREAIYLKKVLQETDPSAFVIFLNASEVLGRGFSLSKMYSDET